MDLAFTGQNWYGDEFIQHESVGSEDSPVFLILRLVRDDVIRHLQELFLILLVSFNPGLVSTRAWSLTSSAMKSVSGGPLPFDMSNNPGEAARDSCPTTPKIRRVNLATYAVAMSSSPSETRE